MTSPWLHRVLETARHSAAVGAKADAGSEVTSKIVGVFATAARYPTTRDFLDALLACFSQSGDTLSADTFRVLAEGLCGHFGAQTAEEEGALADYQYFWLELKKRTNSPYATACYADTLFIMGQAETAMEYFLQSFEKDPLLVQELGEDLVKHARQLGGDYWLRYRLARLHGCLAEGADGLDDDIQEQYSELLEEFADNNEAMERIRSFGHAMQLAMASGQLPRTLIRRGSGRTPKTPSDR